MRITPVGKSSTFDPMIKLVSSRINEAGKKTAAQKKKASSPGHNGAVLKESVSKLDDLVSQLMNLELSLAKALEPVQLRSFGYTDKHSLSVTNAFQQLVEKLPQVQASINKIENTPVMELDAIDDRKASQLLKNLEKYTVSLNSLANNSDVVAMLSTQVDALLDASVQNPEEPQDENHLSDMSEYYGVLKEIEHSISSAALAATHVLKDLGYIVSYKKSDIPEKKVAKKEEDTTKKEAGIKSFAALDEKTKAMLKKYWKIIYPSEYIDAQFKNY